MTVELPTQTAEPPPYTTHDPLPNALSPGELRRALNLKEAIFYRLQKEGRFRRFLLPRAIGAKRYSGRLVDRYLNGGAAHQDKQGSDRG